MPGYGYQLAKGATALTESWQALPTVSNNHLMLGHLMEWFYSGLAGIKQAESSVAYKEIEIKPELVGNLTSVSSSFQCPYGTIVSKWTKSDTSFRLEVSIPANTSAVIYVPVATTSIATESNRSLKNRTDIRVDAAHKGRLKLRVGSGDYQFTVFNRK